jgi:hypothetical protein
MPPHDVNAAKVNNVAASGAPEFLVFADLSH